MATPPVFRPYRRSVPRQHRWLGQFRGAVVLIEGNIGSGKTSLGTLLVGYVTQRALPAVFLPEEFPADQLTRFIEFGAAHPGERNPHAFPFQMAMLDARQRTYERALALAATGTLVFVDRGLYGDYCFAAVNREDGHFTDEEWAAYVARVYEIDLLEPTAVVYLETPVDDCRRRMAMRAREAEDKYARDYLVRLDAAHARVLGALDGPLLRVPWGRDRHLDDPVERVAIGTALFKALEGVLHTDRDGTHVTVAL